MKTLQILILSFCLLAAAGCRNEEPVAEVTPAPQATNNADSQEDSSLRELSRSLKGGMSRRTTIQPVQIKPLTGASRDIQNSVRATLHTPTANQLKSWDKMDGTFENAASVTREIPNDLDNKLKPGLEPVKIHKVGK